MGWDSFVLSTFGVLEEDAGTGSDDGYWFEDNNETDRDDGDNYEYENSGEDDNSTEDNKDVIPADEQFAANIFLSNFSEQHAFERYAFSEAMPYIDDVIDFAYLYCKINRRNMLDTAQVGESYYYTLSLENANTVLNRHFDFTLSEADAARFPENEDPFSRFHSFYENGAFYFPAADGESYNRFTVVSHIDPPENGDNRYQMYFDIYKLDIQEYMKANGAVDSGYYYLSANQAANDSRLTWENSGVAIVKPYNNNGTDTYQLLYYRVGEKEPDPNNSKSAVTQRIYTKSDAYSSSDPRDDTGGCMNLGGNYEEFLWGNYLFETPSRQLSNQSMSDKESPLYNLAMLCGSLCIDSYFHNYLVQAYRDLGFNKSDIFLYSYPDSSYNRENALRDGKKFAADDDLAFSIASMPIIINGEETDLVFITARGTNNLWEAINDGTTGLGPFFYGYPAWKWVWEFEEDIFAGLEDYHSKHPDLGTRPVIYVVSGHSLGGAAANLVAARLTIESRNKEEWYGRATKPDDIFCFTYGAIDPLVNALEALGRKEKQKAKENGSEIDIEKLESIYENSVWKFPISEGFENILNVYNLLDTFGPYNPGAAYHFKGLKSSLTVFVTAAGNTGYGKFGLFLSFENAMYKKFPDSKWPTHEIVGYVQAVKNGQPSLDLDFGKKIMFSCPVDVEILQGENVVCRIVSDQVVYVAENLVAYVEDGTKIVLVPDGIDYQVRISATDSGTMDYSVLDLSGNHDLSAFINVPLTAGKTFSSEVGGKTKTSDVKLHVVDSNGVSVSEIQSDGTEIAVQRDEAETAVQGNETGTVAQGNGTETAVQETGFALSKEIPRWLIVVIAVALISVLVLIILLITRKDEPKTKSKKAVSSRNSQSTRKPPAFSAARCCVCGRRLDEESKVFFRTKDGREARVDNSCFRQINTLQKSKDVDKIWEAQRYLQSYYDSVDPIVEEQLKKVVESADN